MKTPIELNYPYVIDDVDRRILECVTRLKKATAPEIRTDLDITDMRIYHRLKMMTLAGLLTVDTSVKRQMTWCIRENR